MTYIADARFSELMQELEDVHVCEVKNLRRENQRLRSQIGVQHVDSKERIVDIDSPELGQILHDESARPTGKSILKSRSLTDGMCESTSLFPTTAKGRSYFVEPSSSDDSVRSGEKTDVAPLPPVLAKLDKRSTSSLTVDGTGNANCRGVSGCSGSYGGSCSENSRPSLLRAISKRFGEYEIRMHWEEVPESAQAAWDQGTTIETIEEKTLMAMSALSKPFHKLRPSTPNFSSSFALRSQSFAPRVSKNASFKPSWRMYANFLHRKCSKIGMPMVDPCIPQRVAWDFVAAFLIVYDLITIPLLVFNPEDNKLTVFLGWGLLLFWTSDIVATFCTGAYIDGQLVMSRKEIIRRYLKTWFIIDCIAVVPDWILKILDTAHDLGRVGGLVRMLRITRVLRLLRLVKLKKLMTQFYDMIANEYMFIVVDLVKLLTLILVLNHIVACLWYAVGYISLKVGANQNWLEDIGKSPVYNGDLWWKYSTSLHWSITQFTAASLDVFATNTGERIFSVLIIFWGLVGLSSFVGSVTTTITALRNMSNDHQKQFWLLRKYLAQCRVSHQLTARILRYLEFKAAAKKNILPASKVVLLTQLSEQLCSQLKKETNNSILDVHPFFGVLGLHMTPFLNRLCDRALKESEFAEADVAFSEAHEAEGMFFIKAGTFRYGDVVLTRNGFLSEAALWTTWYHRENLVAVADINEIINILHEPFGEVMCMHPQPWNFAQAYAEDFVKALNDHDPELLSDISMNGFVNTLGNNPSVTAKIISVQPCSTNSDASISGTKSSSFMAKLFLNSPNASPKAKAYGFTETDSLTVGGSGQSSSSASPKGNTPSGAIPDMDSFTIGRSLNS